MMKISFDKGPKDVVRFEPDGTLYLAFSKSGLNSGVACIRLPDAGPGSISAFSVTEAKSQAKEGAEDESSSAFGLVYVTETAGQEKIAIVDRFGNADDAAAALASIESAIARRSISARARHWLRLAAFYVVLPLMLYTLFGAVVEMIQNKGGAKDALTAAILQQASVSASPKYPANFAMPSGPLLPPVAEPQLAASGTNAMTKINGIKLGLASAAPAKTLYIFEDPNCPSCKELHANLEPKLKDYAVTVLPVAFKPGSARLVAQVLCAANPAAKWQEVMLALPVGASMDGADVCDKVSTSDIIVQNMEMFKREGFTKTPTILVGDGSVYTGTTLPGF